MSIYDLTDFFPQRSGEPTGSVCRELIGRGITPSQQERMGMQRQKPLVSVFLFPLSSPSHRGTRAATSTMREEACPKGAKTSGITVWIWPHIVLSKQASQPGELPESGQTQAVVDRACLHPKAELTADPKDTQGMAASMIGSSVPTRLGRQQLPPAPTHGSCPRSCPQQMPTSSTSC